MKVNGILVKSRTCGLTLVEIYIVVVVVIILGFLLLHSTLYQRKYKVAVNELDCVNNLKEIGLGLTIYAGDNNGRFPFQVSAANSSVAEPIYSDHIVPHYQVASNELENYPKILLCPFDITRQAAASFETLNDSNISYFFNADAVRDNSTNSILSGDRFLQDNGQPVKSGLFVLTTNMNMSWTPNFHNGGGNVASSDGSVQQTSSAGLRSIIRSQLLLTNRLLIP